jgi:hypothetical protein
MRTHDRVRVAQQEVVMPAGASPKREREYKELKQEFKKEGRYKGREEEVASRIVNKQRAQAGETKSSGSKSSASKSPRSKPASSKPSAAKSSSSRSSASKSSASKSSASKSSGSKSRSKSSSSRAHAR